MKVSIDISENINRAFERSLGGESLADGFIIHPNYGTNEARCRYINLPGNLELYHFGKTSFKTNIEMSSVNPEDSDWYLVHINLSAIAQEKVVNGNLIRFQKHLPIGILVFTPGIEMHTNFHAGMESEVVSIRFNNEFLDFYFGRKERDLLKRNLIFEDLDSELERIITTAINTMDNKSSCHRTLLDFMEKFFRKITRHDQQEHLKNIHPVDLSNIFSAAARLRDPLITPPSIVELATNAGMGTTKFKQLFRMVFGKSPHAYHNRIRMEHAFNLLKNARILPSEVSHQLGYSHPSSFTAAFKKYFNTLPSEI